MMSSRIYEKNRKDAQLVAAAENGCTTAACSLSLSTACSHAPWELKTQETKKRQQRQQEG